MSDDEVKMFSPFMNPGFDISEDMMYGLGALEQDNFVTGKKSYTLAEVMTILHEKAGKEIADNFLPGMLLSAEF